MTGANNSARPMPRFEPPGANDRLAVRDHLHPHVPALGLTEDSCLSALRLVFSPHSPVAGRSAWAVVVEAPAAARA